MSRHRRSTRRRAGVPALLAAGLLLVGAACSAEGGSQDVSTGPGAPSISGIASLNQAAAATNEVQTFKVALTTTLRGVEGADEISTTATGEVDRAGRRAHLLLDAANAFDAFDAFDAAGGDEEAVPGAATMELVVDGDTAYLRSPLLARLAGSDKAWVSASSEDLGPEGPGALSGQGDPQSLLALLEGAGGTLTELGREQVRGVDTRHVSTVIDVEAALAQLSGDRHRELADDLSGLGAEVGDYVNIPAEAWVDDDGHVRRLSLTLDFSPAAEAAPELADAAVVVTVELYDFDVPVDIAVPDAADVAELDPSTLLGGN